MGAVLVVAVIVVAVIVVVVGRQCGDGDGDGGKTRIKKRLVAESNSCPDDSKIETLTMNQLSYNTTHRTSIWYNICPIDIKLEFLNSQQT